MRKQFYMLQDHEQENSGRWLAFCGGIEGNEDLADSTLIDNKYWEVMCLGKNTMTNIIHVSERVPSLPSRVQVESNSLAPFFVAPFISMFSPRNVQKLDLEVWDGSLGQWSRLAISQLDMVLKNGRQN
jgi:hypothetical protein